MNDSHSHCDHPHDPDGQFTVQFGDRTIDLDLDSAYELQIELARQLAEMELCEYPEEEETESEGLSEGRSVLEALARAPRLGR